MTPREAELTAALAASQLENAQLRQEVALLKQKVDALVRRDYPVIQGLVLMFSFVYVLINLSIDLIYTLLDPRIRY